MRVAKLVKFCSGAGRKTRKGSLCRNPPREPHLCATLTHLAISPHANKELYDSEIVALTQCVACAKMERFPTGSRGSLHLSGGGEAWFIPDIRRQECILDSRVY